MTLRQEAASWLFPASLETNPAPAIGSKAPPDGKLPLPDTSGRATIITFLRHCGCPFAEKTMRSLQIEAKAHPELNFVAVSHSSAESTEKWLSALPRTGDLSNLRVIVDDERKLYASWGLGPSSFWHVLNPASLYSVYKLGKTEEIWNRPTETGNRWQTSGSWAVDPVGVVKWGRPSQTADDVPDFKDAVEALRGDADRGN